MALRHTLALALLLAGACSESGTIEISILQPQDSDLLSRVERLRATLSSPRCVSEATRDDGGLKVSLEVAAGGGSATVLAEGFDADDNLIAVGTSGPLPIASIDAEVSILMAEPMSMSRAPVNLNPPRAEMGVAELGLGGLFAGGIDADGQVRGELELYSVYTHSFDQGAPLPSPVSAPAVVAGSSDFYYIVGGNNEEGNDISSAYAFDASVPPDGRYSVITTSSEIARSGSQGVPLGQQQYFFTGNPGVVLDGFRLSFVPIEGGEGLDGAAVSVATARGLLAVVVGAGVEPDGAALIDATGTVFTTEPPVTAFRANHVATRLPGGDAVFVGGTYMGERMTSALVFRSTSESFEQINDFLATGRNHPAIAATSTHLIVAGGVDENDEVVGTVEVFAAADLSPQATLDLLVPRTGASAVPLGNGQVLIAGGRDADDNPIGILEIFTPAPP